VKQVCSFEIRRIFSAALFLESLYLVHPHLAISAKHAILRRVVHKTDDAKPPDLLVNSTFLFINLVENLKRRERF